MTAFHDWGRVLQGASAVVHAAGLAHIPHRTQVLQRDRIHLMNVATTVAFARAAAEAGVRHFIFVSSIAVNGSNTATRGPFSETDEPAPATVYGTSKLEAEGALRSLASTTYMGVTAVRPPMIYGHPWRGSFDTLVRAILRGIPLPLASIQNCRAFVSVDNVASFVCHRLQSEARNFESFIVADDEQVSTPEFVRLVGRALGKRPRILPCPPLIVRKAVRLAGRGELIDSLFGSLQVDTSKAKSTGWRPLVSMREGLARACANLT
jgi:UDP-glucose 4-epimerase